MCLSGFSRTLPTGILDTLVPGLYRGDRSTMAQRPPLLESHISLYEMLKALVYPQL